MSRARQVDNSTAVSLFPFLAVLLCTMGALLVVLVAVSRAAREAALREAATQQPAQALAGPDPEVERELQQIEQFQSQLTQLRAEAEQKLRDDQLRLGQLESHMRQLQDRLQALKLAAAELDAMEEEHYDDRLQAQREIERLERLVAEMQTTIDDLKEGAKNGKRKYALIPYEGPNGTFRRPIYIECRQDELILQPEGVRVTRHDLRPPLGPGSPLAAALRAARDHYVRLHPGEGQSRAAEPYPLLVVRPDGLIMYDRARRAIENADFDFGFELAEDDWDLEYGVADPQLASTEQQAIDQARIRQRALAAAAPRAYGRAASGASGSFAEDDEQELIYGGIAAADSADRYAGGTPGTGAGVNGVPQPENNADPARAGSTDPAQGAASGRDGAGGEQLDAAHAQLAGDDGATLASGGQPSSRATSSSVTASGGSGGESLDPQSGQQVTVSTNATPPDQAKNTQRRMSEANRGKDWALDRKKPNDVPIRRTVQVVVRGDHVAILADDAKITLPAPGGKRIALEGDTAESIDEIVTAVRTQIDSWGIAGDGLYWRPVLILNVAPDGRRRAEDLGRLLKNSGLELRMQDLTTANSQGGSRATR